MSERTDPGAGGFARMRAIADAVLYEGYLLYPYRASSDKNRLRWQFGVLAPRAWSEATGFEPWWMQTELLVEADGDAPPRIEGCARFLQPEERRLEARRANGSFEAVAQLEIAGRLHQSWDEASVREVRFALSLDDAPHGERGVPIGVAGAVRVEPLLDERGERVARYVREVRP